MSEVTGNAGGCGKVSTRGERGLRGRRASEFTNAKGVVPAPQAFFLLAAVGLALACQTEPGDARPGEHSSAGDAVGGQGVGAAGATTSGGGAGATSANSGGLVGASSGGVPFGSGARAGTGADSSFGSSASGGGGAGGGGAGGGSGAAGGVAAVGGASGTGAVAAVNQDLVEPELSALELQPWTCQQDGQVYCYGTNQRVQLVCHDTTPEIFNDTTPEIFGVCPPYFRCDSRPDRLGECSPVLPECIGQEPYVGLCVGDTYVECGVELTDRAYEEACTDRCVQRADGADCIHAGCGNGVVEVGEACDDANNTSGDGCSAACAWDPVLGVPAADVMAFGEAVAISGDTIAVTGYRAGLPEVFIFRAAGPTWRLEALLGVAGDASATNQEAVAAYIGHPLALDGDTLAVAADSVDGVDSAYGRDAVFLYRRTGTTWRLEGSVIPAVPSAPGVRDDTSDFGSALALSGDTLAVGAWFDFEAVDYAGAVYVYRRAGTEWQPEQKVFAALPGGASDAQHSGWFGVSVALSGDRLAVGASGQEGATFQTGAAYVFARAGGQWSPEARFMPPQPAVITYDTGGPQCGSAVAIAGDTMVVGCRDDWEEVPAGSLRERGVYGGSAYVVERGAGAWETHTQIRPLQGVDPGDDKSIAEFGSTAVISADAQLICVGSPNDSTASAYVGSAHVFRRSGSVWKTEQKVVVPLPRGLGAGNAAYGSALALSGEDVLLGGPGIVPSGGAFLYQFTDPTWEVRLPLRAVLPE